MHRNSDWTRILRPSGKDLSTVLQDLYVKCRWVNFHYQCLLCTPQLLFLFQTYHISNQSECFPKRPEVTAWRCAHQQGWLSLVFQESFCSFEVKHSFGQICPYFFKIKRIWAWKFIHGRTAILSSSRRNFWQFRKTFFLRKGLSPSRIEHQKHWNGSFRLHCQSAQHKANSQSFCRSLLSCVSENSADVREA